METLHLFCKGSLLREDPYMLCFFFPHVPNKVWHSYETMSMLFSLLRPHLLIVCALGTPRYVKYCIIYLTSKLMNQWCVFVCMKKKVDRWMDRLIDGVDGAIFMYMYMWFLKFTFWHIHLRLYIYTHTHTGVCVYIHRLVGGLWDDDPQ